MKRPNESVPEMEATKRLKVVVVILAWGLLIGLASPGRCASSSAGAVPLAEGGQARAVIVLPKAASESTQWAVSELQRDLRALSGVEIPVTPEDQLPANGEAQSWILIGGPGENARVKEAVGKGLSGFGGLKNDGFVVKTLRLGKRPVVVAGGDSDAGTMYAVFELLTQLGVTFRLTGDILAERQPSLSIPALSLRREPNIEQRGFLVEAHRASIAVLGYEDWTRLFDQMAKMKYNRFNFWWFGFEPYLKYSFRGEANQLGDISTKASGYINSMYEGFGSRTTDDVVIGKESFPGQRLAPPELQHVETPEEAFAAAQDLLRRMIHYASGRHVKVWLVDEMGSLPPNLARYSKRLGPLPFQLVFGTFADPLDPVNREIQANRLKAMIDTYPEAGGYFLNFPELYYPLNSTNDLDFFAQPQQQALFEELRTLMVPWGLRWVGSREEMINNSLGFIDLFKYLLAKKDEFAPHAHLGVMTLGRGYVMPLLDKMLPKDIPFATQDTGGPCGYGIAGGMPMSYFGGMGERARIASPYLDDDCDILGRQFNLWVYTQTDRMYTDGIKNGMTGIMPWVAQPRGTEATSNFLAEADWNPQLTREEFYKDYSARLFGPSAAPDMYRAFMTLEENKEYLNKGQIDHYPSTMKCCDPQVAVGLAYQFSKQEDPYDGPKGPWWDGFILNAPVENSTFEHSIALLDAALARMQAAEPKAAPQGKRELDYLISRTETYRDDMRAQILERQGFLAFDRAFRERDSVSQTQFVRDLEASLPQFGAAYDQARIATTEYARIIDYPSDLEDLYHLNVGTVLGFDLVRQWMETIVNFHKGKPYAKHVPFEKIFPEDVHNTEQ